MKLNYQQAGQKTWNNFKQAIPIIIGVILLLSLVQVYIPAEFMAKLFTGNIFIDPVIGATIGSIMAGNPITSYITAGTLLSSGVTLVAILAFIIAWVTVGLVQLPAESLMLGKKFAIWRNVLAFISAIIIAILIKIIV